MPQASGVESELAAAWHRDLAQSSLERWLGVCEEEGWGRLPANPGLLVRVFGASWYFTRFIFYRGMDAARLFDDPAETDFAVPALAGVLESALRGGDLELQLEHLRLAKNEIMLKILIASFRGELDEAQEECALSHLARALIQVVVPLFELDPAQCPQRLALLGMGRLAGNEMTYGSDLDLIFLFEPAADGDVAELSRRVRRLLRHLSTPAPAGTLYDIDMRLRPHGTAGALMTSAPSFIEYHAGARETWERQMMTRCLPVYDPEGLGRETMTRVLDSIYAGYDPDRLRRDIRDMRLRVERELGRPQGKLELKRGRGGIMDIDFICHFVQLSGGGADPGLRACSARETLRAAASKGLIREDCLAQLSEAYEFLRAVERCLRLFDVKNVSVFPDQAGAVEPLARAMGFASSVERFLDTYREITANTRRRFEELLGPPAAGPE